ncbi:MAG: hypothetical protein Q8P51_13720, partial [Ignavibacteria bacterium]|nr:hypothetical protein [Ignavibacteria bacterium]
MQGLANRLARLEKENTQRDTSLLDAITNWKKKKEESTEKRVGVIMVGASVTFLCIIYVFAYFAIDLLLSKWDILEPIVWLVSLLVTLTLILIGHTSKPVNWRMKITEMLFNRLYRSRLADLNEFESTLGTMHPSLSDQLSSRSD